MIDSDSDSRLVATTQGNSDSDSDSAPLVMVMHSTHGVKNPGLPTLIYKKKLRPARHRYFRYWFGAVSAMGFPMTLGSSESIL